MNTWNRFLSLLLSIMMLACAMPSMTMAEASNDDELSQAFASGLAPDFWGDQLDTPMAINDFCALMMRIIEPYDASLLPEWESLAGTALGSTREMKREDAMIAVYQAACLMGQGRDTTGDWLAVDALLSQGEHFWELSNEYPEWNNLDNDAPFCTDCDKIIGGAYHFAQGQVSLTSGKRVFDLDEENKDLHMLDPLTKGETLLILQRFGESLTMEITDVPEETVQTEEQDDELSQGFASGLAPDFWSDQLDTPMAINDFCALMMRIIEPYDASLLPEWESLAGTALGSTREMKREDAMMAVYEAACLMEQAVCNGDWGAVDIAMGEGDHAWELSWDYPDWANAMDPSPFCEWGDTYVGGAYHFAQGQVSLISGKRVFDLDEENKDLHMLDPLTKGEALLILQRFGESLKTETTDEADALAQPEPTAYAVQDTSYLSLGDIAITKDGHRYQTTAYQGDSTKDVYVSLSAIDVLFGEGTPDTVNIEQKDYANLTAMCAAKQVSSYTYDEVLNAVYIWSELPDPSDALGEDDRIAYYDLGMPSDDAITYREFFAAMDKAVEIVDADKLPTWQESFASLRDSEETLNRCEAMVAMLRLALALGGEYPEFNSEQYDVKYAVEELEWPTVERLAGAQREKGNPLFDADFPYDLGGFTKNPEVYEWDINGVAFNYLLLRKSNVSGNLLLDYDPDENTMHFEDMLTKRDAFKAIVRVLDSSESAGAAANFVSLDDSRITMPNEAFLPASLLERSTDIVNTVDNTTVKNFGAVVSELHQVELTDLNVPYATNNIRRFANWGFNSVRYMISYQTLFAPDAATASIKTFEQLDRIVAAALQYKIHLNLTLADLPGHWAKDTAQGGATSRGEFDLFTNKKKQEQAKTVWRTIALRYKDVPTNALSFHMFELMNGNCSTGLPYKSYTMKQAANVCTGIIHEIASVTPDRLVLYELQQVDSLSASAKVEASIDRACDNARMTLNYCDMPFVYANMTAVEGEHIDNSNRAMFQSLYPVTYYNAQWCVAKKKPLVLDGDLPAGTEIKLYLDRTYDAGNLVVYMDDEVIYEEKLPKKTKYAVTNKLSSYIAYAESDKCIEFTLADDAREIRFEFSGYCVWAGMAVTLPQEYAVKRWFQPSAYEAFLETGEMQYQNAYEAETSTILISPTMEDATVITIHSDISYSTPSISCASNADTVDAWFAEAAKLYPNTVVRCECADFSGEFYAQVRYLDDVLATIQKYGLGYFTNEFDFNNNVFVDNEWALGQFMTSSQNNVPYENGWLRMDMFKVFQKYLPITVIEEK